MNDNRFIPPLERHRWKVAVKFDGDHNLVYFTRGKHKTAYEACMELGLTFSGISYAEPITNE